MSLIVPEFHFLQVNPVPPTYVPAYRQAGMAFLWYGVKRELLFGDVIELEKRYEFPENVELLDGGTKRLALLPSVEGKKKLLFIDAINLNEKAGTVGELTQKEMRDYFATELSVHQIALPDLIEAGKFLERSQRNIIRSGSSPKALNPGMV